MDNMLQITAQTIPQEISQIAEELSGLDHISLREVADFLEKQAEALRHKAVLNMRFNDERMAAAVDFMIRTPRIVMRHLQRGCTLEEAQKATANECKIPINSIKSAWGRFLIDKNIYESRRRNRLIVELACMGFSNADIGRKVDMHPNSISRIIKASRTEYFGYRYKTDDFQLTNPAFPPENKKRK